MKPNNDRYPTAALAASSLYRILEAIFERRARCQVLSSQRQHETPWGSGETSRRTSQPGWQYERSIGFLKPAEVAELADAPA